MDRTISEIYQEYRIMPNLQEHMLRVAAVASVVCDSLSLSLNKQSVMTACLLHDMGNIIKSRFDVFPEFAEPHGVEYWQSVKDDYLGKYGANEHLATLEIIKELDGNAEVLKIVNMIDFSEMIHIPKCNLETQISSYADCRVGPFGVLPLEQRLAEGRERYKNQKHKMTDEQWDQHNGTIQKVEEYLFSNCTVRPEDITDESIKSIMEELRHFVIK